MLTLKLLLVEARLLLALVTLVAPFVQDGLLALVQLRSLVSLVGDLGEVDVALLALKAWSVFLTIFLQARGLLGGNVMLASLGGCTAVVVDLQDLLEVLADHGLRLLGVLGGATGDLLLGTLLRLGCISAVAAILRVRGGVVLD